MKETINLEIDYIDEILKNILSKYIYIFGSNYEDFIYDILDIKDYLRDIYQLINDSNINIISDIDN